MKLRYVIWIALIVLLPLANASLQKPNWGIGDYWQYEGNYRVSEETSFENMSVKIEISTNDVSIKLDVENVEMISIQGKQIPCYKTKMITSSSGRISITGNLGGKPINYNGNFDIKGNGYLYFTTSRLAVAKNDLTINISTDIPLPNMPSGAMNAIMEYSPPLNFMDFPVENGEKWTASSNVTVYYGEISSTNPVKFSFECIGKQGSMYIIKSDYNPFEEVIPLNNTLIFWNAEKGMIEEIKNYEKAQSLDLKLQDYKYSNISNIPPVANFSYEPIQPKSGDNILFDSSKSYDDDGNIISYLWQFGDGSNSTKANPSHIYSKPGKYKVKLTVMDNYGATSTKEMEIEIGSDGEGGGGGGTPGFEIVFLIIAIAIILLRKSSIFK